jgi:hypothetical protein
MNLKLHDCFISVHDHDEALSSRLATLRECLFIWRMNWKARRDNSLRNLR